MPLVVEGTHFHSRERVTLRIGDATYIVRTSKSGAFRIGLGGPPAGDPCSSARVLALGVHGERVILPLATHAMCAPASPASPAAAAGGPVPVPG